MPKTTGTAQAPSAVQETKLANGVRVVSVDSHGAGASVSLQVKGGSRAEAVPGTAFVLEQFAFKSTQQRSSYKLMRDVERFGGSVAASAGRESLSYSVEALRDELPVLADALAEAVMQPRLTPWEVNEEKHGYIAERLGDLRSDATTVLTEAIHAAAFGGKSPLGHSILPTDSQLDSIDHEVLRTFLGRNFVGTNVVLAGHNVPHAALVELADAYFLGIPEGAAPAVAASAYQGGAEILRSEDDVAHVAVAFQGPSATSADLAAVGVLQAALGAGPNRHIAFARSKANQLLGSAAGSILHSFAAFAFPYSDVGLVGAAVSTSSANAGKAADLIVGAFKDVAAGKLNDAELVRAKAAYKFAVLANLDSRAGKRDDIASQVLLAGAVRDAATTLAAIDRVTAADVARVAGAALKSAPTLAAIGNPYDLPRYDRFAATVTH